MKKETPKKLLLLSYFPLVDVDGLVPGTEFDGSQPEEIEKLQRKLEESHSAGRAEGVMWVYYPLDIESVEEAIAIIPVLMIDRADEIADHLIKWSEGEIDRRFDLHICIRDEGYAVVLAPNIQESIRRWKAARLIFHEDARTLDNFEVLFVPVGAICPQRTTYEQVKSRIANPTMLGFVDTKKIDKNNPSNFEASNIKVVGPIQLTEPDDMMKQLIDDMFKEVVDEN